MMKTCPRCGAMFVEGFYCIVCGYVPPREDNSKCGVYGCSCGGLDCETIKEAKQTTTNSN